MVISKGVSVRQDCEPEAPIELWTLPDDEKRPRSRSGANRPGFALLLEFFEVEARHPESVSEIPTPAVAYAAQQVRVPSAWWSTRTEPGSRSGRPGSCARWCRPRNGRQRRSAEAVATRCRKGRPGPGSEPHTGNRLGPAKVTVPGQPASRDGRAEATGSAEAGQARAGASAVTT